MFLFRLSVPTVGKPRIEGRFPPGVQYIESLLTFTSRLRIFRMHINAVSCKLKVGQQH